ncbi:hypothetical protein F2Q68_00039350 [Brassica cretica]|uniref:PUM-HD domain-containing protein n=1 Tax=Brassica cretica TaxID=69181 RepID=A0A8S9MIX0_BRACR|nr:hypothetical protein F2Q68_00039350 [Brassica cretica]
MWSLDEWTPVRNDHSTGKERYGLDPKGTRADGMNGPTRKQTRSVAGYDAPVNKKEAFNLELTTPRKLKMLLPWWREEGFGLFVLEVATKYCAEIAAHRHGCCVLQCCVANIVALQRDRLVDEISRNALQLSQDSFGNYVVQYIIVQNVPAGKLQFRMHYVKLATQKFSSHVVEKCLKHYPESRAEIVCELTSVPNFEYRLKDPFGNYVIQTALCKTKFVLEVATKYCAEIAAHRHGCCVLQCCVANIVALQRDRLVDEISRNALQLSQDSFGNYVVQYIIVQNVPAGKLQFRMHYVKLATQKFSSHVVEKCLKHYPESRAEIVCELTSVPNFEYRLKDPFGNYVIQTALCKTKGCVHAKLVEQVSRYGILKSNPYCMKILSKGVLKK